MELFSGFLLFHGRWNWASWTAVLFRSRLIATSLFASLISRLFLDVITLLPLFHTPINIKLKNNPSFTGIRIYTISDHGCSYIHMVFYFSHLLKTFLLLFSWFWVKVLNMCIQSYSRYLAEIIKLISYCASFANGDYIILAFEEKLWQVIVCGYYWLHHHKS